jgi:methyl-accepting chemotaxis protein
MVVRIVVTLALFFTIVHGGLVTAGWLALGDLLAADPARLHVARLWLLGGGAALSASTIAGLVFALGQVRRRVILPAEALWHVADSVARGDLGTTVPELGSHNSLGRLGKGMEEMIAALRRLAAGIKVSAHETAAMSAEIGAGAAAMSAAAAEIAQTSSGLSGQSAEMAESIQRTAEDALALRGFAERVAAGIEDGVERDAELRRLARENRERLDESTRGLATLSGEARASADAADALVDASEEIRAFVTLVRKIARQSKLLALNASMEAARAGEHGEGFAVVASEIRKLATTSNLSAERTEKLVGEVLERVRESRERSRRTADTVDGVRAAAEEAIASFAQVEALVAATEAWASGIERDAGESSRLVHVMTQRLDSLAHGTETFAAAMEEVAAASEEQSASTEEIAATASALAAASRRLAELVATFRTGKTAEGDRRPARPLGGRDAGASAAPEEHRPRALAPA